MVVRLRGSDFKSAVGIHDDLEDAANDERRKPEGHADAKDDWRRACRQENGHRDRNHERNHRPEPRDGPIPEGHSTRQAPEDPDAEWNRKDQDRRKASGKNGKATQHSTRGNAYRDRNAQDQAPVGSNSWWLVDPEFHAATLHRRPLDVDGREGAAG